MASDLRRAALFEMVSTHAATIRAARYREQAAQLRELADLESQPGLKRKLAALAQEYEELAETVKTHALADA